MKTNENQLIIEVSGDSARLRHAFAGIDFNSNPIPVELAAMTLAADDLLLVDSFKGMEYQFKHHMSGDIAVPESVQQQIDRNADRVEGAIMTLSDVLGTGNEVFRTSEIAGEHRYDAMVEQNRKKVMASQGYTDHAAGLHQSDNTFGTMMYTIHQVSTCEFFANNALRQDYLMTKVGPQTEKGFDALTEVFVPYLAFAYLQDAHATKSGVVTAPYKMSDCQTRKGTRIILGEPTEFSESKMDEACESSLQSLCRIASQASISRNREGLSNADIMGMPRDDLVQITKKMLVEHVLAPYNKAVETAGMTYRNVA